MDRDTLKARLVSILDVNYGYTAEEKAEFVAERLIAAGIKFKPLSVGTKIYQTDGVRVYESTIKNVLYDSDSICFDESAIGSSIFLSKEEAENKITAAPASPSSVAPSASADC